MGQVCPCGAQAGGPAETARRKRGDRARTVILRELYRGSGAKVGADAATRAATRSFMTQLDKVLSGDCGVMPEDCVSPFPDGRSLVDAPALRAPTPDLRGAYSRLALVKVCDATAADVGLGTDQPAAMLSVRPAEGGDEISLLDLSVRQVLWHRKRYAAPLPLTMAVSTAAVDACKQHCGHRRYLDPQQLGEWEDVAVRLGQAPLLTATDGDAEEADAARARRWVSAGAGSVFDALHATGRLAQLLSQGFDTLYVSDVENAAAAPDPGICAAMAAEESVDCLVEVCEREDCDAAVPNHYVRTRDGVHLREPPQCDVSHLPARHQHVATGGVWLRITALLDLMQRNGGALPVPPCCRRAADGVEIRSSSAAVCVGAFPPGAVCAVRVPRSRYAALRGPADLLRFRSDVYGIAPDNSLCRLTSAPLPRISLLPGEAYRTAADVDRLCQGIRGTPSLLGCRSLQVNSASAVLRPGHVCSGDVVVGEEQSSRRL